MCIDTVLGMLQLQFHSSVYFGPKPFYIVADLDLIKDITVKHFDKFVNRTVSDDSNAHIVPKLVLSVPIYGFLTAYQSLVVCPLENESCNCSCIADGPWANFSSCGWGGP